MKSTMKIRMMASVSFLVTLAVLLATAAQANAQAASRFLGAITAINGTTLTVKTDAGETHQVDVPTTAVLKQVAPGEKDLTKAVTIEFNTLATGDRVLVRLDPKAPEGASVALQIIAIKQADLAKKQEQDREDWQRRGVGGLVKSVDSTTGVIVLTSGAGTAAKTVTVHTTGATVLKRYAPASVRYDEAKAAPITTIQAGDQLRARGVKSADGSELAAEEVVSGSFRNISGTITSIDAAGQTLVVKDLGTKKQVTIRFTSESQMRKLPDTMAAMLARVLKGDTAGFAGRGGGGQGGYGGGQGGGAPMQAGGAGRGPGQAGGGQGPGGGGPRGGFGGGGGGFDPQMMLSRAPAVQFADLKKGDAVMLVATQGASDVTAITLLAGVEPLLEAPAASNLLSNWSMNSGAEMAQ